MYIIWGTLGSCRREHHIATFFNILSANWLCLAAQFISVMPAKVKVKILACRNLPIMDRSNETTDAYVEIKLGNITQKTDVNRHNLSVLDVNCCHCMTNSYFQVKRKTLNPIFNSDWFRFEIDDSELQDEVLQIRVMDYDTYSANDAIGKITLSLNPLLLSNDTKTASNQRSFSGWVPIFDTLQGIRGEINFIVKVDLFLDLNKHRQSSCGVQFFHSTNVPFGFHAVIRGFVEELYASVENVIIPRLILSIIYSFSILCDDPEHDWIDKIRKASTSNETRQVTFMKLAGQIQRKIGLKAVNMGGNAVVGFRQHFDLEKDTIVARGIGTCVTLIKIQVEPNGSLNVNIPEDE